ncbi:MAG: outer membrane beta-barrel protein, partial [Alistipes communis]
MRRTILLFVTLFTAMEIYAQSGSVTATVIDASTREGVPGAVVEFAPADPAAQKRYFTTGYKGRVEATVPYGTYKVSVSFLGYETLEKELKLSAAKKSLGTLELAPSSTEIEAVVKEVKSMRTSQKGDTVSYNAGAFKVTADADVEGLLKKMPGITITDGEVEAQGETVKKVFVDGKEFFGEDVTSAIKSLPAQAVDKVEVYDKLSDAAEFSGMDDGEGYKAINIVTKPNMRQGQFGKLYAGYGYQPETEGTTSNHKYNVGGNVNLFHGSSRVSVIGLFNNVNQQNFSFEDILGVSGGSGGRGGVGALMVRPQSGVASVNSFGVNYSDSWGKTGRQDKVTLQASYFFNRTTTKNYSTIDKWYETPSPIDTLHTDGYSNNTNGNHRLNARLEWRISENQSLMSRTGLSFQSYDPYSTTYGHQWGESGLRVVDNFSDGGRTGVNLNQYLSYRTKLGKDGRTLTLDGSVRYRNNRGDTDSYSNQARGIDPDLIVVPTDTLLLRYQRAHSPSFSYNLRGDVTYTEPVSQYAQLSLQYRVAYNYQESDKKVYVTPDDRFETAGVEPDPSLSQSSNTGYLTHRIGPGFRIVKGKNRFVANVSYQRAQLTGEVLSATKVMGAGDDAKTSHGFNNLTYFLMGQLNINKENSIRLFINSSTDNPGIGELQNVYDISNAQSISKGNPHLRPSYSNNVRFHYVNSNVEKGRTFMWMFSMQNTSNYITSSMAYDVEVEVPTGEVDGGGDPVTETYNPHTYSTYTNMDGYWNLRTHLSYGLPVSFLKSNLNVMAGVNYTLTPTLVARKATDGSVYLDNGEIVGGERNDASRLSYDFRAVLGSNISENVDFTLSWHGAYNIAKNSLVVNDSDNKNRYFNHVATAAMKFVFLKSFTFTGNVSYQQNIGFTNDYDNSYVLCNVYLGKKVFRNRRGEVMFGVNDLFDQNTAFSRTTGSGYTQNSINSVIGRYYTVQFVYNLRNFGKRGSKDIK